MSKRFPNALLFLISNKVPDNFRPFPGQVTSTRSPRVMQGSLRFTF
jgi:hypothetical protein